jgi:hypothetical protein
MWHVLQRPILEFGSVELGGYKTLYLDIRNDALLVQVSEACRPPQQQQHLCLLDLSQATSGCLQLMLVS